MESDANGPRNAKQTVANGGRQWKLLDVGEQSDIVGAQTVDTELEQFFRDLVGVDSPCHDTGSEFPRQVDERSVDQRPMRPNVPGPDSIHALAKLFKGVCNAPIQQNAAGNIGCQRGHARNRVVIKRVQGEAASVRPRFLEYAFLDPQALQLDVDAGSVANGPQHVLEAGDGRAAANIDARDDIPRRLGDEMTTDGVVVMYHDDAVRRGVHIQFDRVRAVFECEKEAGEGVFDAFTRRPAVRDALKARGGPGGDFRHTVV